MHKRRFEPLGKLGVACLRGVRKIVTRVLPQEDVHQVLGQDVKRGVVRSNVAHFWRWTARCVTRAAVSCRVDVPLPHMADRQVLQQVTKQALIRRKLAFSTPYWHLQALSTVWRGQRRELTPISFCNRDVGWVRLLQE
jgi:hypothetical protein